MSTKPAVPIGPGVDFLVLAEEQNFARAASLHLGSIQESRIRTASV